MTAQPLQREVAGVLAGDWTDDLAELDRWIAEAVAESMARSGPRPDVRRLHYVAVPEEHWPQLGIPLALCEVADHGGRPGPHAWDAYTARLDALADSGEFKVCPDCAAWIHA